MRPDGVGWLAAEGALQTQPVLLHSVLVKPAEALGKVPAQGDGENVEEDEQSEGVEQRHRVLQEGKRWRKEVRGERIANLWIRNASRSNQLRFHQRRVLKWNPTGLTVVPQECDVEIIADGD